MRCMDIRDFDPRQIEPGTQEAVYLHTTTTPAGLPVLLTALTTAGAQPGPVLLTLAGIHGDEYEGPLASMRLFRELKPADLRGTLVSITVANPLAFSAARRETPSDGVNLNRAFPGDPNGSVTQQIAYWIGERLIRHADACIDLHSGGHQSDIPTMTGYKVGDDAVGQMRRRMAEAFGAPVISPYLNHLPGQAMGFAETVGVPTIYTECPAFRRLNAPAAAIYQRGVRNVLRLLEMLGGPMEDGGKAIRIFDEGKAEYGVAPTVAGFFVPERNVMDYVKAGERLGVVLDMTGAEVEVLRAPADGYIHMRQWRHLARAGGEKLYTIMREYPQ